MSLENGIKRLKEESIDVVSQYKIHQVQDNFIEDHPNHFVHH